MGTDSNNGSETVGVKLLEDGVEKLSWTKACYNTSGVCGCYTTYQGEFYTRKDSANYVVQRYAVTGAKVCIRNRRLFNKKAYYKIQLYN